MTTTHADLVDSRRFVVEDFALDRGRRVGAAPTTAPWSERLAGPSGRRGEDGLLGVRAAAHHPVTAPIQEADALDGTFTAWLQETTLGGAVTAQLLITILVFVMFMARAPQTPWGVMMASVVLILTPWAPVMFDIGDTIAASIVFVNVLSGAFVYKVFAARTE